MALTNRELLSQISNGRLNENEAAELLRLNRKFSYYRNVSDMMDNIYKRNPIKVLDSDDYSAEIAQRLLNSVLNIGRFVQTDTDEEQFGRMLELFGMLGNWDNEY